MSSLPIGLILGWLARRNSRNSIFRFQLCPQTHGIYIVKFHRRRPSSLRALGFPKCWHRGGAENAGPENDGPNKANLSQYVHWVVIALKKQLNHRSIVPVEIMKFK